MKTYSMCIIAISSLYILENQCRSYIIYQFIYNNLSLRWICSLIFIAEYQLPNMHCTFILNINILANFFKKITYFYFKNTFLYLRVVNKFQDICFSWLFTVRVSMNDRVNVSEFLVNLDEMFPVCYSDICVWTCNFYCALTCYWLLEWLFQKYLDILVMKIVDESETAYSQKYIFQSRLPVVVIVSLIHNNVSIVMDDAITITHIFIINLLCVCQCIFYHISLFLSQQRFCLLTNTVISRHDSVDSTVVRRVR